MKLTMPKILNYNAFGLLPPVVLVRLHVGDLHAVGWGLGPRALATPVKAIRVEVRVHRIPNSVETVRN